MKSIQSRGLNLNNKKILIRLDLNVPLNGTNITDTNRIDKTIPTLQYLLENKEDILEEGALVITIEAGSVMSWQKYVKQKGINLGIDKFGESAPYKEVY